MAPWTLKKTDPERMKAVLYTMAETVRRLGILLQPFMPESAGKLLDLVAVPDDRRMFAHIGEALVPGTPLPAPQGVFPRYVEKAEGEA
jgi:methionyl-tRNA synthetase